MINNQRQFMLLALTASVFLSASPAAAAGLAPNPPAQNTLAAPRHGIDSQPLLVAAQNGPQEAGVKLPETAAGRTLAAFIAAFNSGSLETMKRFHSERGGSAQNADKDMEFFGRSGGLRLHSVLQSADHRIEVLAQGKSSGAWLNFEMEVDQSAPHAPVGIRIRPASAPEK